MESELFNRRIQDDHFSPKGCAQLWAEIVGRRLTRILNSRIAPVERERSPGLGNLDRPHPSMMAETASTDGTSEPGRRKLPSQIWALLERRVSIVVEISDQDPAFPAGSHERGCHLLPVHETPVGP